MNVKFLEASIKHTEFLNIVNDLKNNNENATTFNLKTKNVMEYMSTYLTDIQYFFQFINLKNGQSNTFELLKREIIKNPNQQNKIQRIFKVVYANKNSSIIQAIELTYINSNNPKLISVVGARYSGAAIFNSMIKNIVVQATKSQINTFNKLTSF